MTGKHQKSLFLKADATRYVFEKLLPQLTSSQLKTIKKKLDLDREDIVGTLESLDLVYGNQQALKSFEAFSDALAKELQPILDDDQISLLLQLRFETEETLEDLDDLEKREQLQLKEYVHAVSDSINKILRSDSSHQIMKDMFPE